MKRVNTGSGAFVVVVVVVVVVLVGVVGVVVVELSCLSYFILPH